MRSVANELGFAIAIVPRALSPICNQFLRPFVDTDLIRPHQRFRLFTDPSRQMFEFPAFGLPPEVTRGTFFATETMFILNDLKILQSDRRVMIQAHSHLPRISIERLDVHGAFVPSIQPKRQCMIPHTQFHGDLIVSFQLTFQCQNVIG